MHGRYIEGGSGLAANGDHLYRYVAPSKDFKGQDRWSFLVDFKNGKRAVIRYQMNPGEAEDMHDPQYCKKNLLTYKREDWKKEAGRAGGAEA